ncbi:hypothetical protein [Nitrosophilus labii]|uniref:hypothetical protein n=1 Tax=Nitrosophilus labii TaxID=2706014 RepID=UPI001656925F|nr:hypothetical protein [Nitrosophilus labii]
MKKTLLENVISFLLGIFWALLILSALILFKTFYPLGILPALVAIILSSAFWFILIILLEMANIQIEKLKEIKRQTEILEIIKKRLYE